jgi:hypothetical protein
MSAGTCPHWFRGSVTAASHPMMRSNSMPRARGSHSFTSQLNVSAFCGIGGALRDCLGVLMRVFMSCQGVLWDVGRCLRGVKGVFCVRYGSG